MQGISIQGGDVAEEARSVAASYISWGFVWATISQLVEWLGFPGYMQILFVALMVMDFVSGTWAAFNTGTFDPRKIFRGLRKIGYYGVLFVLAAFMRNTVDGVTDKAMMAFSYVILFSLCWVELISFLRNLNKLAVSHEVALPFLPAVIRRIERGGEMVLRFHEAPAAPRHGSRYMTSGDLIILEGEIDIEVSLEIKGVMLEILEKKKRLCIDMAGVYFIDSSGLGALVAAVKTANSSTGLNSVRDIHLLDVPPRIMRILSLHGIDTMVGYGCRAGDVPPPPVVGGPFSR